MSLPLMSSSNCTWICYFVRTQLSVLPLNLLLVMVCDRRWNVEKSSYRVLHDAALQVFHIIIWSQYNFQRIKISFFDFFQILFQAHRLLTLTNHLVPLKLLKNLQMLIPTKVREWIVQRGMALFSSHNCHNYSFSSQFIGKWWSIECWSHSRSSESVSCYWYSATRNWRWNHGWAGHCVELTSKCSYFYHFLFTTCLKNIIPSFCAGSRRWTRFASDSSRYSRCRCYAGTARNGSICKFLRLLPSNIWNEIFS